MNKFRLFFKSHKPKSRTQDDREFEECMSVVNTVRSVGYPCAYCPTQSEGVIRRLVKSGMVVEKEVYEECTDWYDGDKKSVLVSGIRVTWKEVD